MEFHHRLSFIINVQTYLQLYFHHILNYLQIIASLKRFKTSLPIRMPWLPKHERTPNMMPKKRSKVNVIWCYKHNVKLKKLSILNKPLLNVCEPKLKLQLQSPIGCCKRSCASSRLNAMICKLKSIHQQQQSPSPRTRFSPIYAATMKPFVETSQLLHPP